MPEKFKTVSVNKDGKPVVEWPPSKACNMQYDYKVDERKGTDHVICYEIESKFDWGSEYEPKRYSFPNGLTLNVDEDPELIFFLVFVNPHCQLLENKDLRKYQNILRKDKDVNMYLFNIEKQAEKEIDKERLEAEIKSKILSDRPGVGLSEDRLRLVARAFFINEKEMPLDVLRKEMLFLLFKTGNKNNIKDFIKMTEDDSVVLHRRAIIQEAMQLNIIKLKSNQKSKSWHYYNDDTEIYGELICKVRMDGDPYQTLLDHFDLEEKALKSIKSEISLVKEKEKMKKDGPVVE